MQRRKVSLVSRFEALGLYSSRHLTPRTGAVCWSTLDAEWIVRVESEDGNLGFPEYSASDAAIGTRTAWLSGLKRKSLQEFLKWIGWKLAEVVRMRLPNRFD